MLYREADDEADHQVLDVGDGRLTLSLRHALNVKLAVVFDIVAAEVLYEVTD